MRKNRFVLIVVILSIFAITFSGCEKDKKVPFKIAFQTDLETARKTAADKNRSMVIVFFNTKCPWCNMLDDSTFSDKIVIGMSEKMVFVRIDAEKDSALARQFGVAFYPTIVVTRPDGSEIDRLVEYYPPTEFYNEVQLYLIGKETLEDYLTRLEDEPERVEYHLIVAQKYRNRSNWDKALEYYNNVVKLSADDQQDEVEEAMFETTGILAEKENYKTSITACRDFIKRFPDSERLEDVQRRIPYYMAQNGELSKAIKLFEKYLDDYPQGEYVDWVKQRISELNEAIKEK